MADNRLWQALSFAWGLGFLILIPLAGGLFAGLWLDSQYQSAPLFLLAGSLVGIITASVFLVWRAKQIIGKD